MKSNRKIIVSALALLLAAPDRPGPGPPAPPAGPAGGAGDDCTRNYDRGANDGADHRTDNAGGDNKGDLRTRRGNDPPGFRFFKYCVKDYGISGRF